MNSFLWVKYPTRGNAADEALALVLQITHQVGPRVSAALGISKTPLARNWGFIPLCQSESVVHAGRKEGELRLNLKSEIAE
jgi:hypothetical protein